jgi:hypothetical protein
MIDQQIVSTLVKTLAKGDMFHDGSKSDDPLAADLVVYPE